MPRGAVAAATGAGAGALRARSRDRAQTEDRKQRIEHGKRRQRREGPCGFGER